MVQNRVDGRVHFIMLIEKLYHNGNNWKVSHFPGLNITTNFPKENDHKVYYFPWKITLRQGEKWKKRAYTPNIRYIKQSAKSYLQSWTHIRPFPWAAPDCTPDLPPPRSRQYLWSWAPPILKNMTFFIYQDQNVCRKKSLLFGRSYSTRLI